MSPEIALFNAALGLTIPWHVAKVTFDKESKELHIYVDFDKGARFPCPECEASCPVYDCVPDRVWRHLNFFEHKTFLHARFPRVECKTCGIKTVEGSWARPGSGFTLLFEAFVLMLCKAMPVHSVAHQVDEHDTRLWHVVKHYVDQAQEEQDMSDVRSVKVDETARRSGQEYVTLFADGDTGDVLLVTPGKDASTISTFSQELERHGGKREQVQSFCQDMSPAFKSGVSAVFPEATQVVDRFHVMKLVNDAVDKIRRVEVRTHPELKNTRYFWLKNPENLKADEKDTLDRLCALELRTALAYRSKVALRKLWELPDRATASAYLSSWFLESEEILPGVVGTLRKESERILNYFKSGHQTNAMMEGINSLVQAMKAKARGYRNDRYLGRMIYLTVGNLSFPLPTLNSE